MAQRQAPRPWRALGIVAAVLIALYAGVYLGADRQTPKLGIDLRGGTEAVFAACVTAQSATPSPSTAPSASPSPTPSASATPSPAPVAKNNATKCGKGKVQKSSLNKAVDIIRQRVNALGVGGAEVNTLGNNDLVVSAPIKNGDKLLQVIGQTALLRFRQVIQEQAAAAVTTPTTSPSGITATLQPSTRATTSPSTSAKKSTQKKTHGRELSGVLLKKKKPSPSASPAVSPTPSASAGQKACAKPGELTPQQQFTECSCPQLNDYHDNNQSPLDQQEAACDTSGQTKFLLDAAKVQGTQVSKAAAGVDQTTGQWIVTLNFTSSGSDAWCKLTGDAYKKYQASSSDPQALIAIVLDDRVQSAPVIDQGAICGGNAQIQGGGNGFSHHDASQLADVLKYGALPLKFSLLTSNSVSATLGSDELRGGLIAGGIGLGLVIVFSFLYYRALGFVVVASLALSAAMLWAATILLGQAIGYTLSLAGIAGFIVAVGITADSFVVFFERIRDEIREGRGKSIRSAVERGWPRARRTIISADAVSLLAAVVLYIFSISDVRGFAFTLGLSTISDLFIVFLFTKPLMSLLTRTRAFGSGNWFSGLAVGRGRREGRGETRGEIAGTAEGSA